jgi:Pyridoxamine 5'-phosphate oxidase
LLDETAAFGARAARRLHQEIIGWLTTVSPEGAPQPVPVWFLWDGAASMLLYGRPKQRKLANIGQYSSVSLNPRQRPSRCRHRHPLGSRSGPALTTFPGARHGLACLLTAR